MKFPIFASFIVFLIWLGYEIRKNNKLREKINDDFWEKESKANSVRKKNIDFLPYILVPTELLPEESLFDEDVEEDKEALQSLLILKELRQKKILNLNGISNTDLKLEYGTANITVLSEYDENFETFSKHIFLLSKHLYDKGYETKARDLLEETLSSGTDITGHYRLLAQIYKKQGEKEKIDDLITQANSLHSMTKDLILRSLEEFKQD